MINSMSIPICNHFHTIRVNSGKITSFKGGIFDALVWGEPPHPGAQNFVTKNWNPWGSPQWRLRDPSLHRSDTDHKCVRRTSRQTPRRWLRCAMHSAIMHKNCLQAYISTPYWHNDRRYMLCICKVQNVRKQKAQFSLHKAILQQ